MDAPLSSNLCTFGEIGIIANVQKTIKAKFDNHGSSCIFVGYSTTNEIDVFSFYDTKTKLIRSIRNVTWLDKNYVIWKGLKTNIIKLKEDNVDDPGEFGRDDTDDDFFEIKPDLQPIIVEEKPTVHAVLRKLQFLNNDTPEATTTPQSLRFGRELPQAESGRK